MASTTVRVAGANAVVEASTASGVIAVARVSATDGMTAATAAAAGETVVSGATTVAEVNSAADAGEAADGKASAAVGLRTVSCGSIAAGAAGTVVPKSGLLLGFLNPYHNSVYSHNFIINLLSAWSIFTLVLQGFHNDSL